MSLPLAAADGSLIIVGFVVLMVLILAYTYYSIRGSGIDAHPSDGLDGSPGSEAPSDVAKGRGAEAGDDGGDDDGTFSTHGTG